jgi:hypothetical protein
MFEFVHMDKLIRDKKESYYSGSILDVNQVVRYPNDQIVTLESLDLSQPREAPIQSQIRLPNLI